MNRIFVEQHHGIDLVFGTKMRMGTGFGLPNETVPLGTGERTCFWGGWGGSLAVIDVDRGLTISYAMNRMADALLGDFRGALLVFAAYQSLAD